jgi:selenophosphate synthetase-related protein
MLNVSFTFRQAAEEPTVAGPANSTVDLDALAEVVRTSPALRAKGGIGLVGEVFGAGSWVHGPGDDGAVIPADTDGEVVACGEALLPAFVASDPYGAGLAAVLTNVNDLAAMGAKPLGIVDTIVGDEATAREALRGMREGCRIYDVPLIGGHLTRHDGAPALSAFGVGRARRVLSATHVAPGQVLIVACCTEGSMRTDFPFFASFDERGDALGEDVRVLATVAESGACVAAKDVSMAGLIGSLAMLLEWSRAGVTVDLDAVPCPTDVTMKAWLCCFPAFAFLLCVPRGREAECLHAFNERGLAAAVAGKIDDTGVLAIQQGAQRADVLDLRDTSVTGLRR